MSKSFKTPKIWNKFWKDKSGKIVLFQSPNRPLIVFICFAILGRFIPGVLGSICSDISRAALMYWAALEVLQGVNYFRRTLGVVVAVSVIVGILNR